MTSRSSACGRSQSGLSASLGRAEGASPITQADQLSLQSKGYYFTRTGALMSNEGELQASSDDGIEWTLRFGEIVYGSGEAVTAGTDASDDESAGPGENRYLFITASFDPQLLDEPQQSRQPRVPGQGGRCLDRRGPREQTPPRCPRRLEGERRAGSARKRSELNARFASWYYVISSSSFDKVRLDRADLLKDES